MRNNEPKIPFPQPFEERKQYYFASCPLGMEDLLHSELQQGLLANGAREERGGVLFRGTMKKSLPFLFKSRIASKVFWRLKTLIVEDPEDLYRQVKKLHLDYYMDEKGTLKITTIFDHSLIKNRSSLFKNSQFISLKVKDAICDYWKEKKGTRPDIDKEDADYPLMLRVTREGKKFKAHLFLDICGVPLSHRGYREPGAPAPLRENLAAALVMKTDFDPKKDLFMDSMCGTGTFLIEAALIAGNIPPGHLKLRKIIEQDRAPLCFQRQSWFHNEKNLENWFYQWAQDEHQSCIEKISELPEGQFFGMELSSSSIRAAKANIRKSYLSAVIQIDKGNALDWKPIQDPPGLIICNPPYGVRMGDQKKLEDLYFDYGEHLKNHFKGMRAYIFTGSIELRKKIRLQAASKYPVKNGNLDCQLVRYNLY